MAPPKTSLKGQLDSAKSEDFLMFISFLCWHVDNYFFSDITEQTGHALIKISRPELGCLAAALSNGLKKEQMHPTCRCAVMLCCFLQANHQKT